MLGEKGLNINHQNNNGDTPLLVAAKLGAKQNIRIIQKLLEFNANKEITNNNKESFYYIIGKESLSSNPITTQIHKNNKIPLFVAIFVIFVAFIFKKYIFI